MQGAGRRRRSRKRLRHEMVEEVCEILDLAQLVGHPLAGFALLVRDAEGAEPRGRGRDAVGLDAVVGGRGGDNGHVCRRGVLHVQPRGAVGLRFKLRGLRRREEMGIEEIAAEHRLEQHEGFVGRMILGHIARPMTPDERELRPGFQRNRSDKEILERGVGSAVLAERELRQRRVAQGGAE